MSKEQIATCMEQERPPIWLSALCQHSNGGICLAAKLLEVKSVPMAMQPTREEIEARLASEPTWVLAPIVCRTAFRALPALSGTIGHEFDNRNIENDLLALFRCAIKACTSASQPQPNYGQAASRAHEIADIYAKRARLTNDSALNNAAYVAFSLSDAAQFAPADSELFPLFRTYSDEDYPLWSATESDLNLLKGGVKPLELFNFSLWNDNQPEVLKNSSAELLSFLEGRESLKFWARWYQLMATGHPPNWQMQNDIASISDEHWVQGAGHVAQLVWEIEARYLAEATPFAEKIELNEETGKIEAIKAIPGNPKLFQTTLRSIEDAIFDLTEDGDLPQFAYALAPIIKRLKRTVMRYSDDPQRVHDDLFLSARQIERLMDVGEVPPEPIVDALLSATQIGAIDIRAADETVRASVEARAQLQLKEMNNGSRTAVEEAIEILLPIVDDSLREELEEDLEELQEADHSPDEANVRFFRRSFIVQRMIARVAKLAVAGAFSITVAGSSYTLISEFVALVSKRENWLVWREQEFGGLEVRHRPSSSVAKNNNSSSISNRKFSMDPITALSLLGSIASIISLIKSTTGKRPSAEQVVEQFRKNAADPESLEHSVDQQVSRSDVLVQAQSLLRLNGLEETVIDSISEHCYPKIFQSAALPGGSAEQEEKRQEATKCICGALRNYLKLNGGKFDSQELKDLWLRYDCAG